MPAVRVKFFHNEMDNCQGGSGKTIQMERIIELQDDIRISDIRNTIIDILNNQLCYSDICFGSNGGFTMHNEFTGRGIISITI